MGNFEKPVKSNPDNYDSSDKNHSKKPDGKHGYGNMSFIIFLILILLLLGNNISYSSS